MKARILAFLIISLFISQVSAGILTNDLDIAITHAIYNDCEGDSISNDIYAEFSILVNGQDQIDYETNLYIYLELPSGLYFDYIEVIYLLNGENHFTLKMYDHALELGDYYLYMSTWYQGKLYTYAHDDIIFDPPGSDNADPSKGITID